VKAGGLPSGGFNFDAKLRRQSVDRNDLFHGHIGGLDTLAKALLAAAELLESGALADEVAHRYARWEGPLGRSILDGEVDLAALRALVQRDDLDPPPVSGGQERLENRVNRAIDRAR
jgi:xylose isomerase